MVDAVPGFIFYFFFFSSRRRHTRLQGDWSSDVCSSDLFAAYAFWQLKIYGHKSVKLINGGRKKWLEEKRALTKEPTDRKSGVEGKRVELGGRRIIKKKKKTKSRKTYV